MANKPVGSFYAIRPWLYAMFVEAYGAAGQTGEGRRQVAEALALGEKSGFRFYEAALHRLHGELLLMQSAPDPAGAEICLQQTFEFASSQQAKSLELRAAVSLARFWGQQSKKVAAHKLLTESYNWFNEGSDTADLREAKALLEDLSN